MSYRRGRFGGSRFGGPKPVESGKEYDVQVTEISRKGDGVARVQGFIVFVKGGRVGQKARVRVTHVGDRFATAETIDGGQQQQQQQVEQQHQSTEQSTEQSKDVISPQVSEEEKPELQDYASSEAEEIKPEEQPPTG
ncbi:MAG TPA: TRAM domain-containing protein [Nitrososphaera sp.]|jgi:predicted RNA-binding protein with TRAM domain|nr:TRAM domain-containing protein [Nitrososphaera sp.]